MFHKYYQIASSFFLMLLISCNGASEKATEGTLDDKITETAEQNHEESRQQAVLEIVDNSQEASLGTVSVNPLARLVRERCVACHATQEPDLRSLVNGELIDKESAEEIWRRVNLPENDPLRMPRGEVLSNDEKYLFEQWKNASFPALDVTEEGASSRVQYMLILKNDSANFTFTIDRIPFRQEVDRGHYTLEITDMTTNIVIYTEEINLEENLVVDISERQTVKFDVVTINTLVSAAKSGIIDSVDDLLNSLPQVMRDNFVLMETSRSRHTSSLEHPRIILFGVDARMIIGISTDPNDPNYNTLELMEFQEENKSWKLRALTFGDVEGFKDDDTNCQVCHGHPARPIWGPYRNWPGAYGNDDDAYTGEQVAILRQAINKTSSNKRLSALNIDLFERSDGSYGLSIPSRFYGYNNTVFNQELSPLQALAIHHRISSHEDYESLKKYIVALAPNNPCDLENFPASQSLEQLIFTVNLSRGQYEVARNIYTYLGAEMNRDFTLGHPLFLLEDAAIDDYEDIRWFGAFNDLHQDVSLLILKEILDEKQNVAIVMADIRSLIDNTYWYSFLLKGSERGEVIKTSSVYMGGYQFFLEFFEQGSNRINFCNALLN